MEYNSIIGAIPWPVSIATAAWFGAMAHRAGKSAALWALGGALLGLIVTTIIMGLAQATFIPFYSGQVTPLRLKTAMVAIVLIMGVGWLFTGSLHRRALEAAKLPTPPPPAPPAPAKTPTTPGKQ